jgi:hypothetical protein
MADNPDVTLELGRATRSDCEAGDGRGISEMYLFSVSCALILNGILARLYGAVTAMTRRAGFRPFRGVRIPE